ncbi:homocysteine S-methyltransferase family protein [Nisaea sp.]|uniref:homocysteine S-methyltransferase family protein n=1 Tax=Nisaea sp. TaxID=2024842 RepID=UPI0025E498BF|nr:homocysteine S-methyltransferase family protein [Nisaea sp.]
MMQEDMVILDGGMSRELERLGAPFRQPEWSALALFETPDIVERVHAEFIEAGAEVITTNNYAVVPFHIGEERFAADGRRLIELSGRLARSAADRRKGIRVAGSIPPVFGSYLPQDFDAARAPALLGTIVAGLAPHADLWLIETTSSIEEMKAAAKASSAAPKPLWVSYTLHDDNPDPQAPKLRSGEPVRAAVEAAVAEGAEAVLFNCSAPEVMEAALRAAVAAVPDGVRVGVYANAFTKPADEVPANDGVDEIRHDLDPAAYAEWARRWRELGAAIVGGCCGIGCAHIAALRRALKPSGQSS